MNTKILPLVLAILTAPLVAQGLTPQQVMNLKDVIGITPSSDGQWLIYTVAQQRGPDDKPGPGRLQAFLVPLDQEDAEPEPFPETRGLAWRPGAEGSISYVAKRDGDEKPQLYARGVEGDDETRLSSAPNGVGAYRWRPDGQAFAFTALDPEPALRANNLKRGFAPRIVDEDFRHVSLWLWDLEAKAAKRLTEGLTVQDFTWSPTGDALAVAMSPRNLIDDHYVFTRLYVVDAESGQVEPLVDNPGKLGPFAFSPDGRQLAYVTAADRSDPHAGSLAVVDIALTASGARRLTHPAADWGPGMVRDVFWHPDGRLGFLGDRGTRSGLWFVGQVGDVYGDGEMPGVSDAGVKLPAAVEAVEFTSDGQAVAIASRPDHGREVYVQSGADRDMVRRTDSNPWLADVALGEQEVVTITARDGLRFEGLLIRPIGEASAATPLVIVAHGGPESHYRDGWVTRYSEPGQVLAGMGYHVWYPNYRASTGYGVEFAKADHGDPMGGEFTDHLDAIDHFAAQGLIDPERVGIIGGSYGGYTAAWAATKESARFAAAVSFVPFTDIRTKWMTSDIPYEFFFVHYQEMWPHEQPGLLADRSPLTWAHHCDTPLLLCGGDSDPRVHPSQPFMLYRAVKFATDTPTRYVQFPGEVHGNRTNVYRYDYLLRSLRWLDWYLREPDRRDAELPPKDLEYPAWR